MVVVENLVVVAEHSVVGEKRAMLVVGGGFGWDMPRKMKCLQNAKQGLCGMPC